MQKIKGMNKILDQLEAYAGKLGIDKKEIQDTRKELNASQWQVVARGVVKSAEFGFPNRLTINLDSFPTKIDTTLIEVNRKYEIAVREIDE